MSLLSMYRRDDSRAVYRILAEQAIKHLDQPTAARESKILFTNIARLLERYRYDAFSYDVAPGIFSKCLTGRVTRSTQTTEAPTKRSMSFPHLRRHMRVSTAAFRKMPWWRAWNNHSLSWSQRMSPTIRRQRTISPRCAFSS